MEQANPFNIWEESADGSSLPSALTNEMIAVFEEEVGLKLPQAFVDLLKVQNGGSIRFEHPDMINEGIFGVGPNHLRLSLFRLDQEDHGGPISQFTI